MEIKIEMSPMTKDSMVNYFGSFLFGIKYPKHVKKKHRSLLPKFEPKKMPKPSLNHQKILDPNSIPKQYLTLCSLTSIGHISLASILICEWCEPWIQVYVSCLMKLMGDYSNFESK